MAFEAPDKFMRRDLLVALGNMSIYRITGFNTDRRNRQSDTRRSSRAAAQS